MANDHPINDPNQKKDSASLERQAAQPVNNSQVPAVPNNEEDLGESHNQAPQAQGAAPAEPVGTADPNSANRGARGTAAMDVGTRREVARKGGIAVSRNREHMAEIGRKGGQSVSRNREHMARIGRKGGTASRGSSGSGTT